MKAYWGVEVYLHSYLDLGTRWSWVVSFTPRSLYPQGKSPWYPLDRRLSGIQSRSGRGGLEKNSQPPPGIESQNPDRPARSQALYRLSYHGSQISACSSYKVSDMDRNEIYMAPFNVKSLPSFIETRYVFWETKHAAITFPLCSSCNGRIKLLRAALYEWVSVMGLNRPEVVGYIINEKFW
jgi:hypothetical protein